MSELSAEALLENLQNVLATAARVERDDPAASDALRQIERNYGARATHDGRLLCDLVTGSYAWDLFQGGRSPTPPPRLFELCRCAPLLQIMRDSGELSEREELLRGRDAQFVGLWQTPSLSEEQRRLEAEALQADYQAQVRRLAEKYRLHYTQLRRATSDRIVPLAVPRVHSRPLLQPPLMAMLFSACHADKSKIFQPYLTPEQGGMEFRYREDALRLLHPEPPPTAVISPEAEADTVRHWAMGGVENDIAHLDEMAWDMAAIAVSTFFARTPGRHSDEAFLLLLDDYFDWRGIDPRKRSAALRRQIAVRIELLCSDRVHLAGRTQLWTTDAQTGNRRKALIVNQGPFLIKRSRFHFTGEASPENVAPDGYLVSLGGWAQPFVENRAMFGVFCKRLAEYDLRRRQWERRIGWYLVFQFNNQGSKMTFEDVVKDGRERTLVTPQHPFKMRTVLTQSHVPWEAMARTNPGKVITQWCEALGQLRKDGLLGEFSCLDGAMDGSDLPARGRLDALLERRFQIVPGRLLLSHLRAKKRAALAKCAPR